MQSGQRSCQKAGFSVLIVLLVVSLFGFTALNRSPIRTAVNLMASVSVFLEGTYPSTYVWPDSEGHTSIGVLGGVVLQSDTVVNVPYPRSLGPLTKVGDPPLDQSIAIGVVNTLAAINGVLVDDPTAGIKLFGVSQGALVVLAAVAEAEKNGVDTSEWDVVVVGNPASNTGGLLAGLPWGYIPGIGVWFGQGTTPSYTPITQITNEYDGATDAPTYPLNLLATLNAFIAGFALDAHHYDKPLDDSSYIVSESASGLITDIFIPYQGLLPLLQPLRQLGVPEEVLVAFDPFVRALVDMGYDRSYLETGVYPDQPVRWQLVPSLDQLIKGLVNVFVGAVETVRRLAVLTVPAQVAPSNISPVEQTAELSSVVSEPIQATENQRQMPESETAPDPQDEPQVSLEKEVVVTSERPTVTETESNSSTEPQTGTTEPTDDKDDDAPEPGEESDEPSEASEQEAKETPADDSASESDASSKDSSDGNESKGSGSSDSPSGGSDASGSAGDSESDSE